MTPKSLLRHPEVTSTIDECATGMFQRVLPDELKTNREKVSRILLCAGKIYYELRKRRKDLNREDVAIIRIEQLYPLRKEVVEKALEGYKAGTAAFWVQEEPENMGAWRYMRVNFGEKIYQKFPFSGIYRDASASPATGSAILHKKEQEQILVQAFEQGTLVGAASAVIAGDKHGPTA
jgi:2-oxoglutarate dehydrogenase E1 component